MSSTRRWCLPATMGTSGSASSGFYFIDQGGFMASAASNC